MQNMGDDDYSSLETEIETLKAIYIHELEVNHDDRDRPSCVTVHLYPATADNVTEQFVRMSLILQIPSEYPLEIPEISIRNTRGLSDEEIESVYQSTVKLAEERKGNAMLFELIEVAKEHLTVINIPSCECAICLYGFVHDDALTKTECFHYFHSHCLARYVCHILDKKRDAGEISAEDNENESDMQVACPVCRLPISFPFSDKNFPPPAESQNVDISVSTEQRKLQEEMQELFIKQKEKGGIIDLEAEKNKFLLEISNDTTANRSDAETAYRQSEQHVVEKQESLVGSAIKAAKKQLSTEKMHKNENYLGNSSNDNKDRYCYPLFRNSYKQHSKFSSDSERPESLEHNLESINSPKDDENEVSNEEDRIEVIDGSDKEGHISKAVDDSQQKIISSYETDNRNSQRNKFVHRGTNRRPFRSSHYSRQTHNWVRNVNEKTLQRNEYKYNREENNAPIQTSTNSFNNDVERKPPRRGFYHKSHFRKYNERHQPQEKGECSKEYEDKSFEAKESEQKNTVISRSTEHCTRSYKNEQKFQSSSQKQGIIENTSVEKYIFQDQNSSEQNIDFDSSTREIGASNSQTLDTLQNHKAGKRSSIEEDLDHSKIVRRMNSNHSKIENSHNLPLKYDSVFSSTRQNLRKEYSEVENADNVEKEITIQETREHIELKEKEYKDRNESKRDKKYINTYHNNNNYYNRRNTNGYQGFQNRYTNKHQMHSYEGRKRYNRQHPNSYLQTLSKDSVNDRSDKEYSKGTSDTKKTTGQHNAQLDGANNISRKLENYKEEIHGEVHKDVNSYDRDNYRTKSKSHKGFYYRTNERRKYNSEVWDKCIKNGSDVRQPEEEQQLPNSSELSLIENDEAETGKQNQKVNDSTPKKSHAKVPSKNKNIYFYPKSKGNFHNNNRTINESYHNQKRQWDTRGNANSKDARRPPAEAACPSDTIEQSSHR